MSQFSEMDRWKPISEVNSNTIFKDVKIGDDVAILQYNEDYWYTGIVIDIETYVSRNNRYQERPMITVKLHKPLIGGRNVRIFYEECVEQIAFKDC